MQHRLVAKMLFFFSSINHFLFSCKVSTLFSIVGAQLPNYSCCIIKGFSYIQERDVERFWAQR